MPPTIALPEHALVAVSRSALTTLRSALLRDGGPAAAAALQEAGYAGGDAVFSAFRAWLQARGEAEPETLDLDVFQRLASHFFREAGWGSIEIGSLHDAVATVDSEDWADADPTEGLDAPGCHFTTGMLADFFGRVSDVPLSVLEVECRSAGASRCRFLLGNADVMRYVYDGLENGTRYDEVVARVR